MVKNSISKKVAAKNAYITNLCAFITGGLGISALTAYLTMGMHLSLLSMIGIILLAFLGVYVNKSESLLTSLAGYGLVSVSFGTLISPMLHGHAAASAIGILATTVAIVAVMSVVAIKIPQIMEYYTWYILGGLVILIVGSLGFCFMPLAGVKMAWDLWNVIGIVFFSALIVYDVNKAYHSNDLSPVAASWNALGIYLDIINIVVRLISLSSSNNSD